MINIIKISSKEFWRPKQGQEARVLAGEAWVTIPGIREDWIRRAGERLPSPRKGMLVQALGQDLVLEWESCESHCAGPSPRLRLRSTF
jgi:hypothetical protein